MPSDEIFYQSFNGVLQKLRSFLQEGLELAVVWRGGHEPHGLGPGAAQQLLVGGEMHQERQHEDGVGGGHLGRPQMLAQVS